MSASATAVLWAGGSTGSTVPAPMSDAERRVAGERLAAERRLRESSPKALADPQPHTRALAARGNARRAALTGRGASDPVPARSTPPPSPPAVVTDSEGQPLGHSTALAARRAALTGAESIPAPELQVCQCGEHTVEVGIANALARRKHAAQLTKIEALRAAGPAGPRSH